MIEVQCTVAPPHAEIVVSDDGHGMRGRREDSHGLEIMAERARLIEGQLTVELARAAGHGRVRRRRRPSRTATASRAGTPPAENPADAGRVLQR